MCISTRMGVNVRKIDGKIRVEGVLDKELDNNDRTATTADLTTLVGDPSRSDLEDEEDFFAPPPEEILYNVNGTSVEYSQDVPERRDEPPKKLGKKRPGRSNDGLSAGTTNKSDIAMMWAPGQQSCWMGLKIRVH